jgi:hypothetical protein
VDTKELEPFNLLHYSPVNENGGVLSHPFPVVHNHILCLDQVEGEVLVLASLGQVSDILPKVWPTTVVSSANLHLHFNDGVGAMLGHTVMSEQGVQEGTEHAPLRCPCVEDQCSGCVVTYPYHLGRPVR